MTTEIQTMSKKKQTLLWLGLIAGVLAISALGYSAKRAKRSGIAKSPPPNQSPITNRDDSYVRAARLVPQLRWHLKQLGDRISKPGKERMTIVGTLQRTGDSAPLPMSLTLEFPNRLRLTIHEGIQQRAITFNGQAAGSSSGPLTATERETIESLVYDSEEHFLLAETQGVATRLLGQRFRADDGTTPNYSGPYYDLYEISDAINSGAEPRLQHKIFYFDSTSLLLQKVRYQIVRNGAAVNVETRINNWQASQGQQIARQIVRFENDQPVMTLTINALAIGPRIDDGSFGQ
jgi:hypothetical protein